MAFDGSSFWPKELQLALTGQLEDYLKAADEAVLKAARAAVVAVTTDSKERLRAMVVQAGLGKEGAGSGKGSGRSLASAVRGEVYPATGLARDPVGWIYVQPSSVKIFEAFETGPTITAKDGGLLVIPIPGSPADRKIFGDKPRGSSVLEAFKQRGIELSFVPARGSRPAMLVANSVRLGVSAKGKSRVSQAKLTKSGGLAKGAQSVPLFWLVPETKAPKRLDWAREFLRISNDFLAEFSVEFAKQLEFLGQGSAAA